MTEPLSNVTLAMIVRDELMNPAGGLHAVLSRHLPYFQNVVVLDTGSVDGTRQLLEEMASEYSQLKVYDAKFKGYGPARNTAKRYVKTKYTLMLDADEVFDRPEEAVREIEAFSGSHLRFQLINVYQDGTESNSSPGWNPRLFKPNDVTLSRSLFESSRYNTKSIDVGSTASVPFLHFLPLLFRKGDWYKLFNGPPGGENIPKINPSQVSSYPLWKTPNPATLLKYGVDVHAEIKELEKLGLRVHPGIMERLQQDQEGQQ